MNGGGCNDEESNVSFDIYPSCYNTYLSFKIRKKASQSTFE